MSLTTNPSLARTIRDLCIALLAVVLIFHLLLMPPQPGRFAYVTGSSALDTATGRICNAHPNRESSIPDCTSR